MEGGREGGREERMEGGMEGRREREISATGDVDREEAQNDDA
jgi:hypothetical protein